MEKDVVEAFFNDSFKWMNICDMLDETELSQIFKNAISHLKKNQVFVEFDCNKFKRVVYLSDLHGYLESFEFICKKFYNKNTLFVILGDLIDRGKKTLELFVVVLSLMIVNKNILYIKGNHETKDMQEIDFSLKYFICNQYYNNDYRKNKKLVSLMLKIFKELPLVAYCKGILNFHGGFINKKKFALLQDLKKLKKKSGYKINSPEFQILWNDPIPKTKNFLFNSNYLRGHGGYVFGPRATNKFFGNNKQVKLIITGHTHKLPPQFDYDIDGYHFCHNNKILTILSCFNVQRTPIKLDQNKGGVAVLENEIIKIYTIHLGNKEWKLEKKVNKIIF